MDLVRNSAGWQAYTYGGCRKHGKDGNGFRVAECAHVGKVKRDGERAEWVRRWGLAVDGSDAGMLEFGDDDKRGEKRCSRVRGVVWPDQVEVRGTVHERVFGNPNSSGKWVVLQKRWWEGSRSEWY